MKLYNSLTQKKEFFAPLNNKKVTIYVCGITPYDTTHLGHAFTYIAFDVLIRYLKFTGFDVTYTQNVTDINDRDNDILQRAKQQNIPWQELAKFWTNKFLTDMQALNWIQPTFYLYASQQIPAMLDLIAKILDTGIGYRLHGSVYLDIAKVKNFGKLSKLKPAHMLKVARDFEEDLENPDKKNPLDITLWKASAQNQPAHIPYFDSPYGPGRPGWHLECSAMAMSTLGNQIDIHGGGIDLIFPHHESEIAQSEVATGKVPFVKYWLHTGEVTYKQEKMSKSTGNLVMVADLLKKYSPNAIRFLLLSNHWNKSWEFRESDLKKAQQKTAEIEKSIKNTTIDKIDESLLKTFNQIMDDNLNTPKVLEFMQSVPNLKIWQILGFTP